MFIDSYLHRVILRLLRANNDIRLNTFISLCFYTGNDFNTLQFTGITVIQQYQEVCQATGSSPAIFIMWFCACWWSSDLSFDTFISPCYYIGTDFDHTLLFTGRKILHQQHQMSRDPNSETPTGYFSSFSYYFYGLFFMHFKLQKQFLNMIKFTTNCC